MHITPASFSTKMAYPKVHMKGFAQGTADLSRLENFKKALEAW
jgi:hypothetical protein